MLASKHSLEVGSSFGHLPWPLSSLLWILRIGEHTEMFIASVAAHDHDTSDNTRTFLSRLEHERRWNWQYQLSELFPLWGHKENGWLSGQWRPVVVNFWLFAHSVSCQLSATFQTSGCISAEQGPISFILAPFDSMTKRHLYNLISEGIAHSILKWESKQWMRWLTNYRPPIPITSPIPITPTHGIVCLAY